MKKKLLIPIILSAILLAVLFVPIPKGAWDDGGTKTYSALTYKIVAWNRLTDDGVYDKTRVYFGSDAYKDLASLWLEELEWVEHKFSATVKEIDGDWVKVEPAPDEEEARVSLEIEFFAKDLPEINARVGDTVDVCYQGSITEVAPVRITATSWNLSHTFRHLEYTDEWLDKSTAKKYDTDVFSDIIITDIYSNCFFAKPVIPMPYTIKLNGSLSKNWCVGDQVKCTYENTYYDEENDRIECDFLTVEPSDWEPDPNACYKPVIYLYSEKTVDVDVRLTLNGELTCTYPAYDGGWTVTASPDGTLTDKNGKTYNYLYWEGETLAEFDMTKGFCVKGEDTADFLEYALDALGLTRREANEFIVFWLPMMQENKYNVISFQGLAYTDAAKLEVSPAPDTVIRVFMTWKASDTFVEIPAQELTAPAREGFTVVEWGGTEIK